MGPVLAIISFDALKDAVGESVWTYPAIVAAVALDSLLPIAPGETVVITAGVFVADGELNFALVFLAGMLGGLLGDNISFGIGATLGRRAERRVFTSDRARERLDWARRQIEERGPAIIVAARFIPGGRTATTFAAGTLEMPWRRFFLADVIAAALWSAYVTLLGYFGGSAFTESLWKPLVAAGLVAFLVAIASELLRRAKLA